MPLSLIADLIIVLVLALSAYIGWKQGIVRGLLTLVGSLLALTLSAQIADVAATTVVDQVIRPVTHTAIEQHAEELLPQMSQELVGRDAMEQLVGAISNDFIREKVQDLLTATVSSAIIASRDTLCNMVKELADTVLDGVVQELISTLFCVFGFTLLSLLVRLILRVISKAFRLPVLRQIDQTVGLLLGAVRGLIIIFIAVWALRLLGLWLNDDVIGQSSLLSLIANALDRLGLTPATPISFQ